MKKVVRYTGIQPQYFPRLHYFARILDTDIFVIRDDCQYVSNHKYPDGSRGKSFQSHTPIKHSQGWYLLHVPIAHQGFRKIVDTEVDPKASWVQDQLMTIKMAYGKTTHFPLVNQQISDLLRNQYPSLAELNIATICWGLLKILGEPISKDILSLDYVNKRLAKSHPFRLKSIRRGSLLAALQNNKLSANEKIIAACHEVGATEDYCGGTGLAAYLDINLLKKNGISITVQDWKCREYTQQFSKKHPFIPNLSIVDLLMNVPPKEVVKILHG